jgi:hypothetical protein
MRQFDRGCSRNIVALRDDHPTRRIVIVPKDSGTSIRVGRRSPSVLPVFGKATTAIVGLLFLDGL